MPDKKSDTDIEFVITSDNDGWYRSELKVAGKNISTMYSGSLADAINHFHESFPQQEAESK